jgi:putative membrane protein
MFSLLANAIGFLLADLVLSGVNFAHGGWTVIGGVLVFAFVNTFIKPMVTLLSLPAIIFTLGFFYLIVNGLMIWFSSIFVPGFGIDGFWTAFAMGLIVTLVNWILYWLVDHKEKE